MSLSTAELPPNYRVVLDAVNEYGDGRHASAQDIYLRSRELRPGIGFTTVHRALARLQRLGHILKLDISGADSAMYEPVAAAHAHFRCSGCGAVKDVDFAPDHTALAALEARHGLSIRSQSITFTGVCAGCEPRGS